MQVVITYAAEAVRRFVDGYVWLVLPLVPTKVAVGTAAGYMSLPKSQNLADNKLPCFIRRLKGTPCSKFQATTSLG